MGNWLGLPELASAHGGQLDQMLSWIHVMMIALFVGWGGFFLFCLWRFRRAANPKADYAGVKSHYSTYVEIGVVVLEAIFLVGFSMPLWAERVNEFPPEDKSIVARVIGEQFAWNIHYAGNDGIFGATRPDLVDPASNPVGLDPQDPMGDDDIVSVNWLHLPKDRPAILHISSKDVIHGFGVPELRVKQDAIPGLMSPMWFTPTITTAEMREIRGEGNENWNYEIACAQLCGLGHYRMRGFVVVHEEADFDKWYFDKSTEAAELAGDGGDDFWE